MCRFFVNKYPTMSGIVKRYLEVMFKFFDYASVFFFFFHLRAIIFLHNSADKLNISVTTQAQQCMYHPVSKKILENERF